MRRFHLIEFHEQPWVPTSLRDAATDYLAHVEAIGKIHDSMAPILAKAIRKCGTNRVIDLGSGGAGPWGRLQGLVSEELGEDLKVVLTDLHPNAAAFETVCAQHGDSITFLNESVDMLHVPDNVRGFRTLFSSFHHFGPEDCKRILQDAVERREGIAVVEFTERSAVGIVLMIFIPLIVLLVTPFVKPFRWSRLFWTYLFPVAAPLIMIDGIVSCLRMYTPEEMLAMAEEVGGEGYSWEIGTNKVPGMPVPGTYLVGVPQAE
ncbi:MAG: class I SAM-dependent methyltransferase [Candidatus Hydrogenedentota bacterium]